MDGEALWRALTSGAPRCFLSGCAGGAFRRMGEGGEMRQPKGENAAALGGVESGRGRKPTLSADHHFLGQRYSPVSRM